MPNRQGVQHCRYLSHILVEFHWNVTGIAGWRIGLNGRVCIFENACPKHVAVTYWIHCGHSSGLYIALIRALPLLYFTREAIRAYSRHGRYSQTSVLYKLIFVNMDGICSSSILNLSMPACRQSQQLSSWGSCRNYHNTRMKVVNLGNFFSLQPLILD